jgi:Spy/CpxP family protein refolding chaperone
MKRHILLPIVALVALAASASAQSSKPDDDPLARLLFDPQLVLKFASELSLQAAQRTSIVNAIKAAQGEILERQLEMVERHQELLKAIQAQRVDEATAMAQADKVMELEREMKKSQLLLLIRIKNALTQQQQDQLRELRKAAAKIEKADADLRIEQMKKSVMP